MCCSSLGRLKNKNRRAPHLASRRRRLVEGARTKPDGSWCQTRCCALVLRAPLALAVRRARQRVCARAAVSTAPTATSPTSCAAGTRPIKPDLGVSRAISSCLSTRAPRPRAKTRCSNGNSALAACAHLGVDRCVAALKDQLARSDREGRKCQLERLAGRLVYLGLCTSDLRRSLARYTWNCMIYCVRCPPCDLEVLKIRPPKPGCATAPLRRINSHG